MARFGDLKKGDIVVWNDFGRDAFRGDYRDGPFIVIGTTRSKDLNYEPFYVIANLRPNGEVGDKIGVGGFMQSIEKDEFLTAVRNSRSPGVG